MILNADTPYSLHKQLNEVISSNGGSDAIAMAILHGSYSTFPAYFHPDADGESTGPEIKIHGGDLGLSIQVLSNLMTSINRCCRCRKL